MNSHNVFVQGTVCQIMTVDICQQLLLFVMWKKLNVTLQWCVFVFSAGVIYIDECGSSGSSQKGCKLVMDGMC